MMPPMLALKPLAELYPPTCDHDLLRFARAIATPDLDAAGNFVLRRALSPQERAALEARRDALAPWLAVGNQRKVAGAVNQMLLGWSASGKATTIEEAAAVASQYAVALGGLPLWAVERACYRFAGGNVRPEDVGEKQLSWKFPPSSAHVAILAAAITKPFGEELTRLRMTLGGVPALPAPERGPIPDRVQAWLDMNASRQGPTAEEIAERRKRDEETAELGRQNVLREYQSLGLAPPEERPNKAMVSPTMLMRLGWTIEEVGGERVLVAPPGVMKEGA